MYYDKNQNIIIDKKNRTNIIKNPENGQDWESEAQANAWVDAELARRASITPPTLPTILSQRDFMNLFPLTTQAAIFSLEATDPMVKVFLKYMEFGEIDLSSDMVGQGLAYLTTVTVNEQQLLTPEQAELVLDGKKIG